MAHMSPKRGMLVRAGELREDMVDEQTYREMGRQKKPDSGGKQLTRGHKEISPGVQRNLASKGEQLQYNRKQRKKCSKSKSAEVGQSHDNPAFLGDEGSTEATDNIVSRTSKSDVVRSAGQLKKPTKASVDPCAEDEHIKRSQDTIANDLYLCGKYMCKIKRQQVEKSVNELTDISREMTSYGTLATINDREEDDAFNKEISRKQQTQVSVVLDVPDMLVCTDQTTDGVLYPSLNMPSQCQGYVENVQVISVTPKPCSAEPWITRPHSRSVSSVSAMFSRTDENEQTSDTSLQAFQRSYSMRLPTDKAKDKPKVRTLLRDLSFSDADSMTTRNYGCLRGSLTVPRRKPHGNTSNNDQEIHVHMGPELKSQMRNLLQELLQRGKVRQAVLLSQENCSMLVSVPPWDLSHRDQIGLVKAVTTTVPTMIRLTIGAETYTLFKHGPDKVMGRSGDNVIVAHKTKACVVVGVADDSTPGSCLYEVSELVNTLVNKGW